MVERAADAGSAVAHRITYTNDFLEASANSAALVFAAAGFRQRPAPPEGLTEGASTTQVEGWLARPEEEYDKAWEGFALMKEQEIFAAQVEQKPLWKAYKELVIAQHPLSSDRFKGDDRGWKKEWASIVRNVPIADLGA